MRVLLLGPFEVRDDEDRPLRIAGVRVRALLARLAMEPGRVVPVDALADAIWDGHPPDNGANALQALVSRVRRAVGSARVEGLAAGYRLVIEPVDVDVVRFERLAAAGRESDDLAALREAEALWRGPALTELSELRFAADAAVRWDELRLGAAEHRLGLEVAAGNDVLDEVRVLAEAHPLTERIQGLLIRALYAAGRQADALAAFERTRDRLGDELGIDPSPELSELHLAILRQESATPRRRTNLRAQVTSFVGREDDVAELTARLAAARLITIVGPGGAGKTRLAVEMGERVPGGVWLVELAAVRDPEQVASAVLTTIGVREVGVLEPSAADPVDRLAEYLARQRILLILDNCEHLVDAVAELVERLLGSCPELRVLATSRESFAVDGEHIHQIRQLPWPDDAAEAENYPAVTLFVERARAVRPDFALDAGTALAVVEICRRLDGLPLAIELAAARLRALSVGQIAAKLDDRFTLLGRGSRTAQARHRTLRAVIEWSWAPLSESERELVMWLAVFPAGATLDAVDDLELLAGLVDKSLVELGGERYRMLETIRSYALERLAESGRETAVRDRQAQYLLGLAEASEAELRCGSTAHWAEQLDALARLDAERDNIAAALRFAVDTGAVELGIRLIAAMFWYWTLRGIHTERVHWMRAVLGLRGEVPDELRALRGVLDGLSRYESGEIDDGMRAVAAGLEIARSSGDLPGAPARTVLLVAPAFLEGHGLSAAWPGLIGWERGMALLLGGTSLDQLISAKKEFESLGERFGLSTTLQSIADYQMRHGDLPEAITSLTRAAVAFEELGNAGDAAAVCAEAATALARLGEFDRAATELARAGHHVEAAGEPGAATYVRLARAEYLLRRGDRKAALRELDRAETGLANTAFGTRIRARSTGFRALIAILDGDPVRARRVLDTATKGLIIGRDAAMTIASGAQPDDLAMFAHLYAALAMRDGNPTDAVHLLGVAAAMLGTADRRGYDNLLAPADRAREALGADAFTAAYESTAGLHPTVAIEFLLSQAI
ncbi:BTAD domain-containing putative transcriptional regulator [Nocardia anaemiae]|uniref:BTAD domain-containing putative transcriptional regulator n=1 Tax=Nocardia anaemiae TaxID=263910 RepID=UPI0007A54716|nr:BTAD domain-containing putative transcriptional regulator [Nocardia anaemiae]